MSNYYKDGAIQIPKVTGNITVTVTAAESASNYNNLVPTAIDANGTIYNGVGYEDGLRMNSSGGTASLTGSTVIGFISASRGDVVRFTGVAWNAADVGNVDPSNCYIHEYDSNFVQKGSVRADRNTLTKEGDVYVYTLTYSSAYIRLNGIGNGADLIVTVNEPID